MRPDDAHETDQSSETMLLFTHLNGSSDFDCIVWPTAASSRSGARGADEQEDAAYWSRAGARSGNAPQTCGWPRLVAQSY